MSRSALLTVMMFCSVVLSGQNISVTFTGTGAASQIDSVKATNLTTNQSVTFPGNETLVLTVNTGIQTVSEVRNAGIVYPNPFSGNATFSMTVLKPQTVVLSVRNLVGQVVAQTNASVQAGENEFDLSLATAGIYMVTQTSEQGTASIKVICTDASESENSIQYLGTVADNPNSLSRSALKSSPTTYTLGYTSGEIILYKCFSGIYTTIVTDTLPSSKNYAVEYAGCTDPDGKNYSIVKIGNQIWMAENLAYLPAVSPSSARSETDPYYYVYGYEGSTVASAKAAANYATYGVLYNWPAALTACPSGWNLPTDAEWTILTDYLASYAGGLLKETGITHWKYPNTGATNASGFAALPGGYRYDGGGFYDLGYNASFWSSSEGGSGAWGRFLGYNDDGVYRYDGDRRYGFSVRCLKRDPKPTASFTYSPAIGTPMTNFQFDASGSTDAETATADLEVRWDWNGDSIWDTAYDTLKTSSFQFPEPGNYTVILEVKDGDGLVDTETKEIVVGDGILTDSRDGQDYVYKTIGTQTWMIENLAYLPSVSASNTGSYTEKHYYVYGYEGTSVSAAKGNDNYTTYGVLYNWPAAMAACPSGWHLPTDDEWKILEKNQGMSESDANTEGYRGSGTVGGKMKETGTTHWYSPNTGATNSSSFTALPGGYRYGVGGFNYLRYYAYFWSSSEFGSFAWYRDLNVYYDVGVYRSNDNRRYGFSVRCLQK